jgi:hypothetical protein
VYPESFRGWSRVSNLQDALADWKSAIQQVGNLRYANSPAYTVSELCLPFAANWEKQRR